MLTLTISLADLNDLHLADHFRGSRYAGFREVVGRGVVPELGRFCAVSLFQ